MDYPQLPSNQNFYDDLHGNFRKAKKPQPLMEGGVNSMSYSPTMDNYSFVNQQQPAYYQQSQNQLSGTRLMPQKMVPPDMYNRGYDPYYETSKDKIARSNATFNKGVNHNLQREINHYDQVGDMFDEYRQNSTRLTPDHMPARHPIHQIRGPIAQRRFKPRRLNLTSHGYTDPYDSAMFADRPGQDDWLYWN